MLKWFGQGFHPFRRFPFPLVGRQFSSVVNVVYPGVYERFLSVLNVVNSNLGFILSASCIADSKQLLRTPSFFRDDLPLVVFGARAVTSTVSKSRNRHSPAGMQAAKSKHLSITLF